MTPSTEQPTQRQSLLWFELLLIALIALGIFFRFHWVNWNEGADLHPDEYGLTGTLTALRIPDSVSEYFNTRISPISPYRKYDLQGQPTADGPDNRMRWGQWPIILVRWAAEQSGLTGYSEMRLLGRQLSALADVATLVLLFLTGERLYSRRVGLLATALSALAVMQIQQSHFLTSDNFATAFTLLALYAAVRVACPQRDERGRGWGWYALFGAALGMAAASKINLAPLAGMLALAALLRISGEENSRAHFWQSARGVILPLALAAMVALLTFRVTQPMSFRAAQGDTTLFTLRPNPDWVESMKVASNESRGINAGPPGEQWTGRIPLLFPWVNMTLWGLGLPLGLAAWGGLAWAAARAWQQRPGWRAHVLPLVWAGGYFLFMGTRHVMSIRYFLPIYPMMALFAAWGLLRLWNRPGAAKPRAAAAGAGLTGLVLAGTLAWAWAFTGVAYRQENTRVQATRWVFQNAPAPFRLQVEGETGGVRVEPLAAPEGLRIGRGAAYTLQFSAHEDGLLRAVELAHARTSSGGPGALRIRISGDPQGTAVLAESVAPVSPVGADPRGEPAGAPLEPTRIQAGQVYFLTAQVEQGEEVQVWRTALSNEDWDESLPVRLDGYDPFGQFYRGLTMGVRWAEDENKRAMMLETLAQVDYLVLPSQRGIWSVSRLPEQYPMTMAYYRALFDGSLGFERVVTFQHPFRFGPLYISDLSGRVGWGAPPELPVVNNSLLAAEEAFSIYDHAPVWIFKKSPSFDLEKARQALQAVELPR